MTEVLFFLRGNDQESTPLPRRKIIDMLKTGKLHLDDQISPNGVRYTPVASMLDELMAPEESASDERPDAPVTVIDDGLDDRPMPPAEHCIDSVVLPPEPPTCNIVSGNTQAATATTLFDSKVPAPPQNPSGGQCKSSFWRILSDTLASLGNGSCYLQKLYLRGKSAMLISGGFAMIMSVFVTLLGCVLFEKFFDTDTSEYYIRSLINLGSIGGGLWLINFLIRLLVSPPAHPADNEADFLTAMHGMFNTSMLTAVLHGAAATLLSSANSSLPGAVVLLTGIPAGFFLLNIFVSLRINFMHTSRLNAFWSTICAYIELCLLTVSIIFILTPSYNINQYFNK